MKKLLQKTPLGATMHFKNNHYYELSAPFS